MLDHFDLSTVLQDWVNKGLGMSSRVCATGHRTDPGPLIEKSRALCPGGRFPPTFIHQVIITGLNKLYDLCSCPDDGLRYRSGMYYAEINFMGKQYIIYRVSI